MSEQRFARENSRTRRGDITAFGLLTAISGGALLYSSDRALSDCEPAKPGPVEMTSGSCTDQGGTRQSGGDGEPPVAVGVTGGTYTGNGVQILGTRNSAPAVHVSNTGTVYLQDGTTIYTTGDHGFGLEVVSGGTLYADDITITTEDRGADAITMSGGDAYISLNEVDILVKGSSARGIRAQDNSVVEGTNVSISTTHESGEEGGSHGVLVESGSSVTLVDSTIAAQRPNSSGVEVYAATFIGTRVSISATGSGALSSGVYVLGEEGQVTLTDSIVQSSAAGAHAIFADTLADVSLQDVSVSAAGEGANGLHLNDGGAIDSINVDVAVTGLGASAISMARIVADDSGEITVTGGSLSSAQGALISVEGGAGSITLNGPVVLSPGIVAGRTVLATVTDTDARTADLDLTLNDVSSVTGDITVTGIGNIVDVEINRSDWTGDLDAVDNTANVALGASSWTGKAIGATDIGVDATSEWNITGSSDAVLVTNAGRIAFEPPAGGFSTLTTRNYAGEGGILGIHTALESDSSESNRLVIDGGTASGTTGIVVTNAGGGGALTLGDGILVVDAINAGTTGADSFYLESRAAAGAYEYLLFRGGESDEEDWFLRSYLFEGPEVVIPLYRPEAPLYSPVPAMARQLGLAYLGTLHERVGEQMNIKSQPDQDDRFNGMWARLIGEHGSNSWSGGLDVRASDISLVGIQGGMDIYRAEHDNGHRDHVGVYAAYARQRANVSGFALGEENLDVGKLTLDGPAVGAYWTHYSPKGSYLDAVVQWNWFDVDAKSDYDARMSTSGHGFAASLEAGHPIAIGEDWQIEPQAQIIYQAVSVGDASDAFSSVSWQEDDAVTGRLGARLQYSSDDAEITGNPTPR